MPGLVAFSVTAGGATWPTGAPGAPGTPGSLLNFQILVGGRHAKDRGGVGGANYAVGNVVKAELGDIFFRLLVEKFAGENSNFVVFGPYTHLAKVVPIIQQEIAVDDVMTFS